MLGRWVPLSDKLIDSSFLPALNNQVLVRQTTTFSFFSSLNRDLLSNSFPMPVLFSHFSQAALTEFLNLHAAGKPGKILHF